MAGFAKLHDTLVVMFWVVPSLNFASAFNCSCAPTARTEFAGATEKDTRTGGPTCNWLVALIAPEVAVTVTVPNASPVATPTLLKLRTVGLEEAHCTELVRSRALPSLYVPVAESCWFSPSGIDTPLGLMEIDLSVGASTVTVSIALTVSETAVIVAAPSAFPVARPFVLTATMPPGIALQATEADISCVLASL